jgi:hypothetical protein
MVGVSDALFASIVLLPGFLCIFFPHRIKDVKIRLSEFELTLFSLIVSVAIFILTIVTYLIFQLVLPSNIILQIELSKITVSSLIGNNVFLILYFIYIIAFFIVGLFSISHDVLRPFRKALTSIDTITVPEEYVWDIALDNYKGYVIVETNNDKFFLGWLDKWTNDQLEKELLLKFPELINVNTHERIKINDWIGIEKIDVHRILFLNEDIRRVYLLTDPRKTKSTVDYNVKK